MPGKVHLQFAAAPEAAPLPGIVNHTFGIQQEIQFLRGIGQVEKSVRRLPAGQRFTINPDFADHIAAVVIHRFIADHDRAPGNILIDRQQVFVGKQVKRKFIDLIEIAAELDRTGKQGPRGKTEHHFIVRQFRFERIRMDRPHSKHVEVIPGTRFRMRQPGVGQFGHMEYL